MFLRQSIKSLSYLILILLLFHIQKCRIIEYFSGNNIELTTGWLFLGIHFISLSGSRQSPFLMKILRIYKFSRNCITYITGTQHLTFRSIFRFRITRLHHKVFYDTMKQRSIICSVFSQFNEIISMFRSLIIQLYFDIPHRGLNLQYSFFFHVSIFLLSRLTSYCAASQYN